MEAAKSRDIAFPQVLGASRERTGNIEASFASKLVATRDPNKPVIDRFVLENFGLRRPYAYETDRERKVIEVYNELQGKCEQLMERSLAATIYARFTQQFPWANITNLK